MKTEIFPCVNNVSVFVTKVTNIHRPHLALTHLIACVVVIDVDVVFYVVIISAP